MRKDDIVLVSNDKSDNLTLVSLRIRLSHCRETLLNLLDYWHYMQSVVQPRIMFMYESIFGDIEYEMQNKSRIAAELERRVELLSLKVRRGETLNEKTIEFINMVVTREFEKNSEDYDYTKNNYYQINNYNHKNNRNNGYTNYYNKAKKEWDLNFEAPRIYRMIVKKLHPDIAGESETFKKYWDNVQDAYKNNDIDRLILFKKTL